MYDLTHKKFMSDTENKKNLQYQKLQQNY